MKEGELYPPTLLSSGGDLLQQAARPGIYNVGPLGADCMRSFTVRVEALIWVLIRDQGNDHLLDI